MSRIVKSRQIILNEEKYKLSPLIIPYDDVEEIDEKEEEIESEIEKNQVIEVDIESILEDAKLSSDKILNEAREEQEKIIRNAYEDAMGIMEKSKKEGYEIGKTEGYEKGLLEAEGIIEEANQIKIEAIKKYKDYNINSEEILIKLVFEICEKILNETINTKEDYIFSLVKKSLQKITQTEILKIKVSPLDYIGLISKKKNILPLLDKVDDIQIIQDENLVRGSVLIETDNGYIDGSIWKQFEEVKLKFQELIKSE